MSFLAKIEKPAKLNLAHGNKTFFQYTNNYSLSTNINEIVDKLFLSDYSAAQDCILLNNLHISCIINCDFRKCPSQFEGTFRYLNLAIDDDPQFILLPSILRAIKFISDCIKHSYSVLVHCQGGFSRAPTLICAYLMWSLNLNANEALNLLKIKAYKAEPNIGFLSQLEKWNEILKSHKQEIQNSLYNSSTSEETIVDICIKKTV